MRLYTRKGDAGETSLLGGLRVSKANLRVEAYGEVDELNAVLGWARAVALPEPLDAFLAGVQDGCFRLGAVLAAQPGKDPGVVPLDEPDVKAMEDEIDRMETALAPLRAFVLPGGSEAAARLHLARTVCRRAERRVVELTLAEPVEPAVLRWLNRLSDLLFVAARLANAHAGVADVEWSAGERR